MKFHRLRPKNLCRVFARKRGRVAAAGTLLFEALGAHVLSRASLIPISADTDFPAMTSRENMGANFPTIKSRENVGAHFPSKNSREKGMEQNLSVKNSRVNAGAELPPLNAFGRR